jgi:hypothetical protein
MMAALCAFTNSWASRVGVSPLQAARLPPPPPAVNRYTTDTAVEVSNHSRLATAEGSLLYLTSTAYISAHKYAF